MGSLAAAFAAHDESFSPHIFQHRQRCLTLHVRPVRQALPHEGPVIEGLGGGGGGLDASELYAPSDDSPRPAPRQLADTLKSNSGFDSDESGGMRMMPMGGGGGGGNANSGDGSGRSGDSCSGARGLSLASSDAGGSGDDDEGHVRRGTSLLLQRPWAVGGGQRASRGGGLDSAIEMGSGSFAGHAAYLQQGAATDWGAQPEGGGGGDSGGLDFGSADEMSPHAMRADLRPLEGVVT